MCRLSRCWPRLSALASVWASGGCCELQSVPSAPLWDPALAAVGGHQCLFVLGLTSVPAALQNVPSAPLWDAASATVAGMISASDFIHILVQLRNSVSSGASAMSEAEMDQHTLRGGA